MARIRTILDPDPHDMGQTPLEFLSWLGGPAEIRISGRDPSRCRGLSTLLHGNEPSSVVATWRWLRAGIEPAVDVSIFVMAVDAALYPPGFAHRMLPGRRDLNRCFFPPFDDEDGLLARALLDRVRARPFEAVVDLHNNTGKNPAYGIVNRPGLALLKLVELFTTNCCMLSNLAVGALTEVLVDRIPSAAIECGHAQDPEAHDLALRGIETFLGAGDLALEQDVEEPLALFDEPVRVQLLPGISVAYGSAANDHADLTLRDDIDNHNFQSVAPGTQIGWVRHGARWPIEARGAGGREVSRDHFEVRAGQLLHNSDLVPIMMTSNATVARQDCLCYLMRRRDWFASLAALESAATAKTLQHAGKVIG